MRTQHLDGDVGPLGCGQQVLQLRVHHVGAADLLEEYRFRKYGPELDRGLSQSLLVSALEDPKILRDVQYRISFKLDGAPAAGETSRRRRRALNTAAEYAIERKLLVTNPLSMLKKVKVSSSDRVDPRVLVNKTQAAQLLAAVSYVGTSWDRKKGRRLVAFYAVMYFAAFRLSEAVGLKKSDC